MFLWVTTQPLLFLKHIENIRVQKNLLHQQASGIPYVGAEFTRVKFYAF